MAATPHQILIFHHKLHIPFFSFFLFFFFRKKSKFCKQEEGERRESLKTELKNLGTINFAFDSSYLTEESKETLRRTAEFMDKNPALNFSLTAHTDSRGTSEYNQWLSERRGIRVLEFLGQQGVGSERISTSAFGESKLLNHCKDGVRCTNPEHAVNRRVEIIITSFE